MIVPDKSAPEDSNFKFHYFPAVTYVDEISYWIIAIKAASNSAERSMRRLRMAFYSSQVLKGVRPSPDGSKCWPRVEKI
ncbi:hypothetical protein RLEG12_00815 (plasmid) [Rhizobium leguminosarum bv. trifolii CB782]|nr:hypothetical protein RLEG12_00815 [Rhizobium leguminosarum bv. trifolii CB782]